MEDFTKMFADDNQKLNGITSDLTSHIKLTKGFLIWTGFLVLVLMICGYFYFEQLQKGLVVTGLGDYVSWGMYIGHFVFFVAVSLVGMLITSVLGLLGYKWVKPIGRIAEIIALACAAVAGLAIVTDMGRPDRVHHILIYGRVQSPILWDVTVITTYAVLCALLYYIPLLPDLAIAKARMTNAPSWLIKVYGILSLNWKHKSEQFKILFKSIRVLMILIIPAAFAIHTVTSWLFAVNPRVGWDSTIFGPYFISGAFVAGTAAVIFLVWLLRKLYGLEKYLTESHFDKLGKLFMLVSLVYLYFNANEFLVPGYKLKTGDAHHLHELFVGQYAPMFWFSIIGGVIAPFVLLLFKKLRKPNIMAIIAFVALVAAWFKRYIIVVPTMENPHLPKMFVPEKYMVYTPTLHEVMITIMTLVMALLIITILSKLFPVIPIWEMHHEAEEAENITTSNNTSVKADNGTELTQ
jgi:molybdopterin-containing oxidoreductase family membrane subunit